MLKLLTNKLLNIDEIKKIYSDIVLGKDEDGTLELSFKSKETALEFVKITSKLSIIYRDDKTRYSMQLLADIIKKLNEDGLITKKDLYNKKESEIIEIIENSKYKEIFNIWKNAKNIKVSKEKPENVYFVHHGAKIRYIDPLVNKKRISSISEEAKEEIDKNLSYDMNNYVYLDFNF